MTAPNARSLLFAWLAGGWKTAACWRDGLLSRQVVSSIDFDIGPYYLSQDAEYQIIGDLNWKIHRL
jgi:hypothetical protein